MNYIDIVLGIILIIAAISGFIKGFIVELFSLAALILGVWGAIYLSHYTSSFLIDTFGMTSKNVGLIAFIVTFLVILVVVHLLGRVVTKMVEAMQLGLLNKFAGLLFGVFKAALIMSILLLFFDRMDNESHWIDPQTKEKSQAYEPIKNLVPTLLPFLDIRELANQPEKSEHEVEPIKAV